MLSFMRMGRTKYEYIKNLIDTYPQRQFVLVGDSVMSDPHYYGKLMREYGTERIVMILIRKFPYPWYVNSYRNRCFIPV